MEKNGALLKFYASLQPQFASDTDISGTAGFGSRRSFNMYIAFCDSSNKIKTGDKIINGSDYYKVGRIENYVLGGNTLYLKAIIYQLYSEEAKP